MVQSINTKAELIMKATSFHGLNTYGEIMIGDRGFEFYNSQNPKDCIQIAWQEIDYVIASVVFGKYIPRFAIRTKQNAVFSFSARKPKELLRAMRKYIDSEHMVKSLGFFDVLKRIPSLLFGKKVV